MEKINFNYSLKIPTEYRDSVKIIVPVKTNCQNGKCYQENQVEGILFLKRQ